MGTAFYSDLHVHTNLSFCAPRETTVQTYLPLCGKEGVRVIGFSNHIYFGAHHTENALALREELKGLSGRYPCRILLGAEVETIYHLPPNLLPEEADGFDYVLLSPSHILNVRQFYTDFDLSSADRIRELLVNNFKRACAFSYPVPTGIAHPLYPICAGALEEEIVRGISDSTLSDCFALARENHKSIEIHACLYRDGTAHNTDGLSDAYLHVLSAAKAEGCRFHFGSDAHRAEDFEAVHRKLFTAAETLGLSADDVWEIAR